MKKILYISLLFLSSLGFAQEIVGIKGLTQFADHTEGIKGAFHIFRENALATPLDVDYTVTQNGAEAFVDLVGGTVTIPAYSQVVLVEFSTTSNPTSDETLIINLADASNPDYDLSGNVKNVEDFIITNRTPLTAFEGAEGGGKYAGSRVSEASWRGKDVHIVTTLNQTGTGSLIEGLTNPSVGYIVLETGGESALTGRIALDGVEGKMIAGQTAPSPFALTGYNSANGVLSLTDCNDIVFRYIHYLHGADLRVVGNDPDPNHDGGNIDVVTHFDVRNIYHNHVSIDYGDDELMSARANDFTKETGWITFDYSQWGQGYYRYSPFTTHNTGSLLGALGSGDVKLQTAVTLFSWSKNITHNTGHRIPGNMSGYGMYEASNNVVGNHDYRLMQIAYPQPRVNFRNNYIRPGTFTNNIADAPFNSGQYFAGGNKFSRTSFTFDNEQMGLMYADGNIMENGTVYIAEGDDDWLFNTYFFDVAFLDDPFPKTNQLLSPFDVYYTTTIMTASEALTTLTAAGGAGVSKRLEGDGSVVNFRNTWYQSKVDEIVSGTFSNYVDFSDWDTDRPTFTTATRPAGYDTDRDGMPDVWETANGLDPNTYNPNRQGTALHPYKDNIEVYLDNIADVNAVVPPVINGTLIRANRFKINGGSVKIISQ